MAGMATSAVLSEDKRYRYLLTRSWDDAPRTAAVWILLNPSTADDRVDDQTIRKCVGFSSRRGHGKLYVVNLFAARARYPLVLNSIADPIGPLNDEWIGRAVDLVGVTEIIVGWGAFKIARDRGEQVIRNLRSTSLKPIFCRGRGVSGTPLHPCYQPYSRTFEVFD